MLPPCGRCREFIRQVDPGDLDTAVVLAGRRSASLRDLLPAHEWPPPEPEDRRRLGDDSEDGSGGPREQR